MECQTRYLSNDQKACFEGLKPALGVCKEVCDRFAFLSMLVANGTMRQEDVAECCENSERAWMSIEALSRVVHQRPERYYRKSWNASQIC